MTGSWLEITNNGAHRVLRLSHLILPALALGIRPLAVFIQLTRNTMVEILEYDYIQTAHAKGVSEKRSYGGMRSPMPLIQSSPL